MLGSGALGAALTGADATGELMVKLVVEVALAVEVVVVVEAAIVVEEVVVTSLAAAVWARAVWASAKLYART